MVGSPGDLSAEHTSHLGHGQIYDPGNMSAAQASHPGPPPVIRAQPMPLTWGHVWGKCSECLLSAAHQIIAEQSPISVQCSEFLLENC